MRVSSEVAMVVGEGVGSAVHSISYIKGGYEMAEVSTDFQDPSEVIACTAAFHCDHHDGEVN